MSGKVTAPPNGRLIRLALAFRTDQRLPQVRTRVHTVGGGKMSRRDASSTPAVRRLAFDNATAAALEGREAAKLHHFRKVTLAIVR
jgi:hypothetical protein